MLQPKRPQIIEVDTTKSLIVSTYMDYKKKNEHNIEEIKRVGVFSVLTVKLPDGRFEFPIDPNSFTTDKFAKQEAYQNQLGKCSHFAETLNNTLDNFIGLYYQDRNSADIDQKYSNINKLDYMGARNLMSETIKRDAKFQKLEEINTAEKLKHFTKTFFNFITDRNKFTHGLLYLRYTDYAPIIQYENDKKEIEYAEVDEKVISDFYSTYEYLNNIMTKLYELELAERRQKK